MAVGRGGCAGVVTLGEGCAEAEAGGAIELAEGFGNAADAEGNAERVADAEADVREVGGADATVGVELSDALGAAALRLEVHQISGMATSNRTTMPQSHP